MKLQRRLQLSPTLTSSINHSMLSQREIDGIMLLTRPEIELAQISAIFKFSHSCMFLYSSMAHYHMY